MSRRLEIGIFVGLALVLAAVIWQSYSGRREQALAGRRQCEHLSLRDAYDVNNLRDDIANLRGDIKVLKAAHVANAQAAADEGLGSALRRTRHRESVADEESVGFKYANISVKLSEIHAIDGQIDLGDAGLLHSKWDRERVRRVRTRCDLQYPMPSVIALNG